MCHIWKIVPDLYEAIINLSADSSSNSANTPNSNETQDGLYLSNANISEINYEQYINNSQYSTTNDLPYLGESDETLERILIPEGGYLGISNCSDIMKRLGEYYNITMANVGNVSNSNGVQSEIIVEVRYGDCKLER